MFDWPMPSTAAPAAPELVREDRDKAIAALVVEYRGGSWQEFVDRLEKKHGIVLARVKR